MAPVFSPRGSASALRNSCPAGPVQLKPEGSFVLLSRQLSRVTPALIAGDAALAVGWGGLILALCFQSWHDIPADYTVTSLSTNCRLFHCPVSVFNTMLTGQGTLGQSRCSQPHCQFIPAPGSSKAPAQAVEPVILTPAAPAPQWRHKSSCCARMALAVPHCTCCGAPLLQINSGCDDALAIQFIEEPHRLCLSACGARQGSPLHWGTPVVGPSSPLHWLCCSATALPFQLSLTDYKSATLKYSLSNWL